MTDLAVAGADLAQEPVLELTERLPRLPLHDEIALGALALVGLGLMGLGALAYFQGAPMDADPSAALALAGPGVVALFTGIFFLARRSRQDVA